MFEIELTICIKMDLALNDLERLICHKTQPKAELIFASDDVGIGAVLLHKDKLAGIKTIAHASRGLITIEENGT